MLLMPSSFNLSSIEVAVEKLMSERMTAGANSILFKSTAVVPSIRETTSRIFGTESMVLGEEEFDHESHELLLQRENRDLKR